MYAPAPFLEEDAEEAAAFLAAYPFATLCVNGPDGPLAAHAPMVADKHADGSIASLLGHVARANPFWETAADGGAPALAVFRGPDAYVSPSAYPSKAEHGRVVPTWNYVAAEVRGRLSVETDPERMRPFLSMPTDHMEAARRSPWAMNDAPGDYLAALMRGVVGLRLEVSRIVLKRKLSQNRNAADRSGVIADLADRMDPAAQAVASLMRGGR
jgi:transcriptional regulator